MTNRFSLARRGPPMNMSQQMNPVHPQGMDQGQAAQRYMDHQNQNAPQTQPQGQAMMGMDSSQPPQGQEQSMDPEILRQRALSDRQGQAQGAYNFSNRRPIGTRPGMGETWRNRGL